MFYYVFVEESGELVPDTDFPRVFLLMHKWFMESDDLFLKLRELYENCDDTQTNSTEYQSKICHAYQ